MQDFVKVKISAAAVLDVSQNPALTIFFSKVRYSGATFQISSKSDNKWPRYFVKSKMAAAANLDVARNLAFTIF